MSEGTVSSTNYLYFSLIYVNSIHAHPQVSRPWALNLANKTLPAHETSNIYKVLAQAFFANEKFSLMSSVRVSLVESMSASFKR
ncbi:Uncharacterized protein HZ326_10860 [Fusarium oxysporum f. sp. albedinis]|nr:Uncharacterized protein HZ326_10860 [Fusarium oxysporum f. sp. albedinis]